MHGEGGEDDEGEYALRDGTVIDVLPGRIVVRVDRNDEECGGCGSCPMKGLCHGRDAGHLDLSVAVPEGGSGPGAPLPTLPGKGDRVRIAYCPANAALAALAMFAPALCGLLAGGLAGWRLGNGSDAVLLLGCGFGLAAGVAVSWVLARVSPSLKPKTKLAGKHVPRGASPDTEGAIMQESGALHMQELRSRLEAYLRGKDYCFNPDSETVDSLLGALTKRFEKYGKDYCPCRRVTGDAEKDDRIACPCAYHEQEIAEEGHCHCHLFTKA